MPKPLISSNLIVNISNDYSNLTSQISNYQINIYIYINKKSSLNYFPSTRWHKDKDKGEYGPAFLTFWKNKNKNKWGEVRRCGAKDKYRGVDRSVDCSDGTIWIEGDCMHCCHLMYNTMYDNYWVDNTLLYSNFSSLQKKKPTKAPWNLDHTNTSKVILWIYRTKKESIGPQILATMLLWKRFVCLGLFQTSVYGPLNTLKPAIFLTLTFFSFILFWVLVRGTWHMLWFWIMAYAKNIS